MPFCQRCGNKADDNDVFCKQCGKTLETQITELKNVEPIKTEVINESKSSYNKWVRAVSIIIGTIILFGSISSGIPYYSASGQTLPIIIEILTMPISIILILVGLFPEYINNKVQIKDKYPEIIVGLIIMLIIMSSIQPEPPGGWWNYTP